MRAQPSERAVLEPFQFVVSPDETAVKEPVRQQARLASPVHYLQRGVGAVVA